MTSCSSFSHLKIEDVLVGDRELEGRGGEGQAGLGDHRPVVGLLVADHLVLPHPGEHGVEQRVGVLLVGEVQLVGVGVAVVLGTQRTLRQ